MPLPIPAQAAIDYQLIPFSPTNGRAVPLIIALCLFILFMKRDKHWEYRDELPLRLAVAGSILFIYSTVWQELSTHAAYYFHGAINVASALAIIAAVVLAIINKEAKLRFFLIFTAPLPAIIFLLLHTPYEKPDYTPQLPIQIQESP